MPRTTKTRTISLDPTVAERGKALAERRGFKHSFSGYVTLLIAKDDEQLRREEAGLGGASVATNGSEDRP